MKIKIETVSGNTLQRRIAKLVRDAEKGLEGLGPEQYQRVLENLHQSVISVASKSLLCAKDANGTLHVGQYQGGSL